MSDIRVKGIKGSVKAKDIRIMELRIRAENQIIRHNASR
jgi:hypothetical protein